MFIKAKITDAIKQNKVLKDYLKPGQIVYGISEPDPLSAIVADNKGSCWTVMPIELEILDERAHGEVFE